MGEDNSQGDSGKDSEGLPSPEDALKIWPIDKAVGNVKNTGPQMAMAVSRARRDWRGAASACPANCGTNTGVASFPV